MAALTDSMFQGFFLKVLVAGLGISWRLRTKIPQATAI